MEINTRPVQDVYCVPQSRSTLSHNAAEELATVFVALADPTRLAIFVLLADSPAAVCVCDITASFRVSQPTISHHLKVLRDAGLSVGDKRGKWVYNSCVVSKAATVPVVFDRLQKPRVGV